MDGDNAQSNQVAPTQTSSGSSLGIPIAIILGFGMIAAAVYFSGGNNPAVNLASLGEDNQAPEESGFNGARPVDDSDHIRGNPNAPIMIVEYSDFDCPFCKQFHETMNQVMANYGATGQVAWAYRQFPIDSLHPNASYIAQASECVAKLGGNDAFWTFSDLVFGERQIDQPTNTAQLPNFASTAGVNVDEFKNCLDSGEMEATVQADYEEAINVGARGTPYSIVMVAGQQVPIEGAASYADMKLNIDNILTQISGQEIEVPEEAAPAS